MLTMSWLAECLYIHPPPLKVVSLHLTPVFYFGKFRKSLSKVKIEEIPTVSLWSAVEMTH